MVQAQQHHIKRHRLRVDARAIANPAADASVPAVDETPSDQAAPSQRASFRAHIDFKYIVDSLDEVRLNVQHRMSPADPDLVVELYERCNALGRRTDALRAARNDNANAMKVRNCYDMSNCRR
jgi:hypothetical protein